MKEVKAIIQPHMLDKVVKGLHGLEHFPGVTLHEATGQGHGMGPGGSYQPNAADIFFQRRVELSIVCADEQAPKVVASILRDGHTGRRGDGIITVRTLDEVIRIRTGDAQDVAI